MITINRTYLLYFIFLIIFAIGFYLRFWALDLVFVNEWVARDFDRAFNLIDGNYFPLAGPEYDNGGRLPGPFLYCLLALPLLFNYSYESIIVFNFILNSLGIFLFLWVIKKYFDTQIAIISGIIILIFLPHIQIFGFPFNPAYIFFFIALFMGLLLELVINKNYKCFPLIVLTLSISVQLHLSMAVFYLVPIVILIIFRFKIPLPYIFWAIVSVGICFLPYLFYKELFLSSSTWEDNGAGTIKGLNFWSFAELLKIITVNKTVLRLTDFNGLSYWTPFSKSAVLIYKTFIYFGLSYLIYFIYVKGYQNTKREIVALSCFFIPALVYEVIHPKFDHNWYSFIFIFPIFLITGISIKYFYDSLKEKLKLFFPIGLIIILCILVFDAFKSMDVYQKKVYVNSYGFSKQLFGNLMRSLKLNPKDFGEKVYLDIPILPYSVKRLSFVKPAPDNSSLKNNNSCFYIIGTNYFNGAKQNVEPIQRLKSILNEKILNIKPITHTYSGNSFIMQAFEYLPVYKRNCHQNTGNFFQVSKEHRNLLMEANTLESAKQSKEPVIFKTLKSEQKFNENQELNFINETYVIYNKITKLPVLLELKIKNGIKGNLVQVAMDGYNYRNKVEIPKFSLLLFIEQKNIRDEKIKKQFVMDINLNSLFQNKAYTTNFKFSQDFPLPKNIKINKGEFELYLNWESAKSALSENSSIKSFAGYKVPLIIQ
jgi:hypothetical protein